MKPDFCLIGRRMREKYDKYWRKFDELNDYIYFMLDSAMNFFRHAFRKVIVYDIKKENLMLIQDLDTNLWCERLRIDWMICFKKS